MPAQAHGVVNGSPQVSIPNGVPSGIANGLSPQAPSPFSPDALNQLASHFPNLLGSATNDGAVGSVANLDGVAATGHNSPFEGLLANGALDQFSKLAKNLLVSPTQAGQV